MRQATGNVLRRKANLRPAKRRVKPEELEAAGRAVLALVDAGYYRGGKLSPLALWLRLSMSKN
jgi:hypothetical protein